LLKETRRPGDKRLYLPSTGQVGDSLYRSTREAVLTLKRPIRGIDMRQSIRWIHATSMMGKDDRYEMG
jgi:hypothetical protein